MAPKQIIQGPNRFGVRVFAPNSIRILDSIDRFHRSSTLLISIVIICSILGSSLTDPIAQSSSSSLSSGYPSHHHHLLLNSHPSSSHNSLHHSSPLSLSSSSSSSSSRSSFGDYLPSISRSSISQPSNSLFPIHHQSSSSPNHLHHQQSMLMSSSHHQSLASSQGNGEFFPLPPHSYGSARGESRKEKKTKTTNITAQRFYANLNFDDF